MSGLRRAASLVALVSIVGCSDPSSDGGSNDPSCDHYCHLNIACPNDPDPNCMSECDAALSTCPTAMQSVLDCGAQLPDSALTCDEDGNGSFGDNCVTETDAVAECLNGPEGGDDACLHFCSRNIGCANDPAPSCVIDCRFHAIYCPSETDAVYACWFKLPDSALECSTDGLTAARDGNCSTEKNAFVACVQKQEGITP